MPHADTNPLRLHYGGGLSLMRIGLRALQGPSGAPNTRLAQLLFDLPLPHKWQVRGPGLPAPWQAHALDFEGQPLRLWRRAPNGATGAQRPRVLLLHGWAGSARDLRAVADAVWEAGAEPLLLDLPAHGHSPGWRTHMAQWLRAIQAAGTALGPLQGLVAHSLGAQAAAQAVAQGLVVQRLALLATAPPPRELMRWFAQSLGLGEAGQRHLQAQFEARSGLSVSDFEPQHMGPRLQLPTLLLHDVRDRAAPLRYAQALAAATPDARWVQSEGLGHKRLLSDAASVAAVREHVLG